MPNQVSLATVNVPFLFNLVSQMINHRHTQDQIQRLFALTYLHNTLLRVLTLTHAIPFVGPVIRQAGSLVGHIFLPPLRFIGNRVQRSRWVELSSIAETSITQMLPYYQTATTFYFYARVAFLVFTFLSFIYKKWEYKNSSKSIAGVALFSDKLTFAWPRVLSEKPWIIRLHFNTLVFILVVCILGFLYIGVELSILSIQMLIQGVHIDELGNFFASEAFATVLKKINRNQPVFVNHINGLISHP